MDITEELHLFFVLVEAVYSKTAPAVFWLYFVFWVYFVFRVFSLIYVNYLNFCWMTIWMIYCVLPSWSIYVI